MVGLRMLDMNRCSDDLKYTGIKGADYNHGVVSNAGNVVKE